MVSMAAANIGLVGSRSSRRPNTGMASTIVTAEIGNTHAAICGARPALRKIDT